MYFSCHIIRRKTRLSVWENIKALGTLTGENFLARLRLIARQVEIEMEKNQDALNRVREDYNDFKDTVDFRIEEQKRAYRNLNEKKKFMEIALKNLQDAVEKWKEFETIKGILGLAASFLVSAAGAVLGQLDVGDLWDKEVEWMEINILIMEIDKMMKVIHKTFQDNIKYGRLDLDEFEVTKDYATSLKLASYMKSKTENFANLTRMANHHIDTIERETGVAEAREFQDAIIATTDAASLFVNEVQCFKSRNDNFPSNHFISKGQFQIHFSQLQVDSTF